MQKYLKLSFQINFIATANIYFRNLAWRTIENVPFCCTGYFIQANPIAINIEVVDRQCDMEHSVLSLE
jgi:hypothetical protein